MTISFDYDSYLEHKIAFDALANALQKDGHRVGLITGDREKDPYNGADNRVKITNSLGFKPDFLHMWGANETIANSHFWKCQHLDSEDVLLHFDDDAAEMKKYTGRWIVKVMNSKDIKKF